MIIVKPSEVTFFLQDNVESFFVTERLFGKQGSYRFDLERMTRKKVAVTE